MINTSFYKLNIEVSKYILQIVSSESGEKSVLPKMLDVSFNAL